MIKLFVIVVLLNTEVARRLPSILFGEILRPKYQKRGGIVRRVK